MDLKDILKRRDLDIEKCVRSTDEVMQQVALEVFKGTNIEQIQVALISSVMNIADIYKSKKFSISIISRISRNFSKFLNFLKLEFQEILELFLQFLNVFLNVPFVS